MDNEEDIKSNSTNTSGTPVSTLNEIKSISNSDSSTKSTPSNLKNQPNSLPKSLFHYEVDFESVRNNLIKEQLYHDYFNLITARKLNTNLQIYSTQTVLKLEQLLQTYNHEIHSNTGHNNANPAFPHLQHYLNNTKKFYNNSSSQKLLIKEITVIFEKLLVANQITLKKKNINLFNKLIPSYRSFLY